VNTWINPGAPWLVTNRKFPEGDNKILSGLVPIGNEVPTCVSVPLLASMENTVMSADPTLPTYRKPPAASIVNIEGAMPAFARGVTSVSAPVLEIVNNDTSPDPEFAAYRNFFDG
jgi:hypothetical protein